MEKHISAAQSKYKLAIKIVIVGFVKIHSTSKNSITYFFYFFFFKWWLMHGPLNWKEAFLEYKGWGAKVKY